MFEDLPEKLSIHSLLVCLFSRQTQSFQITPSSSTKVRYRVKGAWNPFAIFLCKLGQPAEQAFSSVSLAKVPCLNLKREEEITKDAATAIRTSTNRFRPPKIRLHFGLKLELFYTSAGLTNWNRKAKTTRIILVVVARCRQCEDGLFVVWK